MTQNKSFERFLADHLADDGSGAAQADRISARIYDDTGGVRQLPRWLALIKEPPMRISSHVAVGSPTVRVAAILVATILLALMVAGAGIAGSRLLAADGSFVVDQSGGGDFTTITEAVAVAEDGDEILVMPGVYEEAVTITKDTTLRGEDRDSVIIDVGIGCLYDREIEVTTCPDDAPLFGPFDPVQLVAHAWDEPKPFGVLVEGPAAEISDLTVRSSDIDFGYYAFAVVGGSPKFRSVVAQSTFTYVHGGSAAEFSESFFEGPVRIEQQSPAKLVGSRLEDLMVNTRDDPRSLEMSGLTLDPTPSGGAEAEIRGNELSGIRFAGPVTVTGNTFIFTDASPEEGSAVLIEDGEGEGWTISDNIIRGYVRGISQQGGSGGDVLGNTLVDNGTGIRVTIGPRSRIASNHVEGGQTGIRVSGSGVVEDNEVTGAESQGIVISRNATVTLTGNTSCDNGEDLSVASSASPQIDDTNTFCDQASAAG